VAALPPTEPHPGLVGGACQRAMPAVDNVVMDLGDDFGDDILSPRHRDDNDLQPTHTFLKPTPGAFYDRPMTGSTIYECARTARSNDGRSRCCRTLTCFFRLGRLEEVTLEGKGQSSPLRDNGLLPTTVGPAASCYGGLSRPTTASSEVGQNLPTLYDDGDDGDVQRLELRQLNEEPADEYVAALSSTSAAPSGGAAAEPPSPVATAVAVPAPAPVPLQEPAASTSPASSEKSHKDKNCLIM
jgi:hypothetical protein